MKTVYTNFHHALVQVHGDLLAGAARIEAAATAGDDLHRVTEGFCQTLLDHHKAEDRFSFPAFRAAGRLRSSDVAFLAARDAEHVDIHRLCVELRVTRAGD